MSIPDSAPEARAVGHAGEARAAAAPVHDPRAYDARIRMAGLVALVRALGEDGAGRFLQLVTAHAASAPGAGAGDYTAERHRWADRYTVDELMAELLADGAGGRPERPRSADVDPAVVDSTEPTAN